MELTLPPPDTGMTSPKVWQTVKPFLDFFWWVSHFFSRISIAKILLKRELFPFAFFLERTFLKAAAGEFFDDVEWAVIPEEQMLIPVTDLGRTMEVPSKSSMTRLAILLSEMGIQRLILDTRLEANQLQDIFVNLYCWRRKFRYLWTHSFSDELEEMKMYCAVIRYDPEHKSLKVAYSYCELLFSRAVNAFKKRSKIFKDHRSFFYSAPRYGAAVALSFSILPFVLRRTLPLHEFVVLGIFGAAMGTITYILFQTIGSIEYDKEEKELEITRANRSLKEKQDLLDQDLEKAQMIQKKILPGADFHFSGLEISGIVRPHSQVSGDFFDVWETRDGKVLILMIDCVGHGLFSALIGAAIKAVLVSLRTREDLRLEDLVGVLRKVLEEILPLSFYAAITFLEFSTRDRKGRFINTGNPVLLKRVPPGDIIKMSEARFLPIGLTIEGSGNEKAFEFSMNPGDVIILFTDGLAEARQKDRTFLGENRLFEIVKNIKGISANEISRGILSAIDELTLGMSASDDQTLVVVRATEEAPS